MSITGQPDGEPGGGPMRVGVAVVDLFTGLYTSVAILAALFRRERTGEGAHIDMALFDTQLAMLANQASNALVSGKDPPRQGNTHPNIVPYQPFEAADKPLIIAVGNDRQFARLAELCGHPEWASDERFATNAARVANRDEMVRLVGDCIRQTAGRRMVRASSKRRAFRPDRSTRSARRLPTSRRSIGRWYGRSPACRWSDRRCVSTASARIPSCRRRRWANIRLRSWPSSASEPAEVERLKLGGRRRLTYSPCRRVRRARRAGSGSRCRSASARRRRGPSGRAGTITKLIALRPPPASAS